MEYCSRAYIIENGDEDKEGKKAKKLSPKQHKELHIKIIKFFKDNPAPSDKEVHKFAESIGMEPDDLETHIYMILGSFLGAGRSKDFKGEYDPKELEMGTKIEMEHTTNSVIAERIAKDHLVEIPGTGNSDGYYSGLMKMEKEAGVED